ncbi:BolA family transcriptional regulator [Acetobacter fabarum]|uniref:BolA family protein n=1 Tax=Acetobacter fabarum TaxID=483199 RepID=UPI00312BC02B
MTSLSDPTPSSMSGVTRALRIRKVLETALFPTRLDILDESHRHAHHVEQARGPAAGVTETHFRLYIVSPVFEGMSRVGRSRRVHDLLAPELADGLHALALTLRTPAEEEAAP